ncbi:DUF6493 family protein [Hymenobacter terrenus]|uniref:DUF6493 family protein n=1 Tax=Hymenobacter terrenus TaxID=1629124 RepID=UPI000619895F|nr:DUF6493 family protein [Hymenobacter terrenus]
MSSTVETFEHIIRHQGTAELLALLLHLDKKEVVAVRAKAKSLHKYLDDYRASDNGDWERLMQPQQEVMLFLTGLATYSRKEALTSRFTMPWHFLSSYTEEQDVQMTVNRRLLLTVLEHARPDWLADWFERTNRANEWATVDYSLLRELESRGLLAHHPWLYAQSLASILTVYDQRRNRQKDQAQPEPYLSILPDLRADATLLTRDLPLLFDFDTPVNSAVIHRQNYEQGATWLTLLPALVESGHLDRGDILTRSLLALRRDFRRPLLTWFKNLFGVLGPTAAERLARQAELIELLAHPLPLVINFALDQLKDLWAGPDFQAEALLQYADGLMTRQDLKTGLKTLLGGFSKILKMHPTQAVAIARLCTAALAHADAAVQERAAKVLAEIMNTKKALLSAVETAEISEGLNQYTDLLASAARTALAPWLAETAPTTPDEAAGAYEPQAQYVPDISPATAIAPVADWHELLFLTGQVLQHDDPAALERWLDGLLRLQPQFPTDCHEPLQPYVLQILPFLKGKTEAEVAAVLGKPSFADGYVGLVQALTLGWAKGFIKPLVKQVNLRTNYRATDPLVSLEQHRLAFVEKLLHDHRGLPLLSTPTHAPLWVAPTTLVQRLLSYEAVDLEPNAADLALALARTVHTDAADTTAAQALLPQLRHEGLRELLEWLLSPAGTPLPGAVAGRKSLLKQFTERLGQLLPASTAAVSGTLDEALPWLWAVAARTRHPTAEFPELASLTTNDYPGVVRPWQPSWELQRKSNTYVEKWKPGKPEVTDRWTELRLLPEHTDAAVPNKLLLYSLHTAFKVNEPHHIWHYIGSLSSDYPFLVALLPQYQAPLHWHTLRLAATRDTVDSTTRDVLSQALRSLLGPGPQFDEPATLLLAVGLTHNAPVCRALALEVLLAAVELHRLAPANLGHTLGHLFAADFVPIQRLADGLAQARAISPTTDDALRQTLEALLPELPTVPLRNTGKLLEAYADLLARARQPVPAAVQSRLREWKSVTSLKKAANALLA